MAAAPLPMKPYGGGKKDHSLSGNIQLKYRCMRGVWYLEWYTVTGAFLARRKAHDTEAALIGQIEAARTLAEQYRRAAAPGTGPQLRRATLARDKPPR